MGENLAQECNPFTLAEGCPVPCPVLLFSSSTYTILVTIAGENGGPKSLGQSGVLSSTRVGHALRTISIARNAGFGGKQWSCIHGSQNGEQNGNENGLHGSHFVSAWQNEN